MPPRRRPTSKVIAQKAEEVSYNKVLGALKAKEEKQAAAAQQGKKKGKRIQVVPQQSLASPETAKEEPLPFSLRHPASLAAQVRLQPVLYKRFHADNPPLPATRNAMYRLAATLMMRDEAPYIGTTIDAAAPFVDCFVVLDTGSKDDSIDVVRALCVKHAKPCYVLEIPWIEFGPSRNHLMAFVERVAHFALLLDASDEVRGGENLARIIAQWDESYEKAYVLLQWNIHTHEYPRLVRTAYQLRYTGVRHNSIETGGGQTLQLKDCGLCLFQDRGRAKQSDAKYKRDAEALLAEHLKNPDDTRTVFYLAQSYKDSGDDRNAYKFYKMRATMGEWHEEVYMSLYYCGMLAQALDLGFQVAKQHYLDAFEVVASPLCAIELYRMCNRAKRYNEAHAWIIAATTLPDPQLSLQGDLLQMGYKRWLLLGSSCAWLGLSKESIEAYTKAQTEFLYGEYNKRIRVAMQKSEAPKPDGNAEWFDWCWEKMGVKNPEYFCNVPLEYLSPATRAAVVSARASSGAADCAKEEQEGEANGPSASAVTNAHETPNEPVDANGQCN